MAGQLCGLFESLASSRWFGMGALPNGSGKGCQKITLAEAASSGAVALLAYCFNHAAHYGGCSHSSRIEIAAALSRWGADRRLDELPLVCSRCGSRRVDVRCYYAFSNAPTEAVAAALLDQRRARKWNQPRLVVRGLLSAASGGCDYDALNSIRQHVSSAMRSAARLGAKPSWGAISWPIDLLSHLHWRVSNGEHRVSRTAYVNANIFDGEHFVPGDIVVERDSIIAGDASTAASRSLEKHASMLIYAAGVLDGRGSKEQKGNPGFGEPGSRGR